MKYKEFKEKVFEIAFGDDAVNGEYTYNEVLQRLKELSDASNMPYIYNTPLEKELFNTIVSRFTPSYIDGAGIEVYDTGIIIDQVSNMFNYFPTTEEWDLFRNSTYVEAVEE